MRSLHIALDLKTVLLTNEVLQLSELSVFLILRFVVTYSKVDLLISEISLSFVTLSRCISTSRAVKKPRDITFLFVSVFYYARRMNLTAVFFFSWNS